MTDYLIDTDICIFALKNKFALPNKIKQVGEQHCFICEVTVAEVLYGAHNSDNFEDHKLDHIRILAFASALRVFDTFNLYGQHKAKLRREGNLIPDLDLLIGVTALHHNMTLVTNNTKHMSRIEGLRLENWTQSQYNEFV